jgi:hypothetical protein
MKVSLRGAVGAGVTLLALSVASVGIASESSGVKPTATHGALAFRQVNGQEVHHAIRGRLAFVRQVRAGGGGVDKTFGGAPLSGGTLVRPGKYRIDSFSRHCTHCFSGKPKFYGRKFAHCSRWVKVEAKKTTRVRIRFHRKHPCTTTARGPSLND